VSRVVAYLWGLGLAAAAASPLFRAPSNDGFPLSTYPMFATQRVKPSLVTAEGTTVAGAAVALPPNVVSSGAVMQAMATLSQAESQGDAALRKLCANIAERAARAPALPPLRRVQIVSARFDPIAYFETGPRPEERRVLVRCRVPEGP
jgi:hypothetical protein